MPAHVEEMTEEGLGLGRPEGGWAALRRGVWLAVRALAAQFGMDEHVADEVLQEALLRLFVAYGADEVVRDPAAWVRRTAKRLLIDIRRGRRSRVGPARSTPISALGKMIDDPASEETGPVDAAILRDLRARAPALLEPLPPPYREIATCQLLLGGTRREVCDWLARWNEISSNTGKKYNGRTHQVLRAMGEGLDLRQLWPERFSRKTGPWRTPPPPFSRL